MFAQPQEEHRWLRRFVGRWTYEAECIVGPDQPPMKNTGTVTGTLVGEMWLMLEMIGPTPDGIANTSILTLGYDLEKKQYVGTFIASVMTNLWIYAGSIEPGTQRLVLDTTGPKFDGPGQTQYQDTVEWISGDEWVLSSRVLGDDGNWVHFMRSVHKRA